MVGPHHPAPPIQHEPRESAGAVLGLGSVHVVVVRRRHREAVAFRLIAVESDRGDLGLGERHPRGGRRVDRPAQAEDSTRGFSRLVLDRRGRVVWGPTIVSPRAGESLAEVTLAVRHGLRAQDLAGATHPYPTYSDGVWKTSVDSRTITP